MYMAVIYDGVKKLSLKCSAEHKHPWDQKKCPFLRGVHLREVKNTVFVFMWLR